MVIGHIEALFLRRFTTNSLNFEEFCNKIFFAQMISNGLYFNWLDGLGKQTILKVL